jgi:hypothetical protein
MNSQNENVCYVNIEKEELLRHQDGEGFIGNRSPAARLGFYSVGGMVRPEQYPSAVNANLFFQKRVRTIG